MFNLPYWQYLEPHSSTAEDTFIQQACLTIIIAGAAAHGNNCCYAFGDKIQECHAKVKSYQHLDSITEDLRIQAAIMLDIALTNDSERDFEAIWKFDRDSIHEKVIRHYYLSRSGPAKRSQGLSYD